MIDPKKLKILRLGSRGPEVKAAKITIYQALKIKPKAPLTSFYGPLFAPLVRRFKKSKGLKADNVIGYGTWRELLKIMGPAAKALLTPPEPVLTRVHPIPKGVSFIVGGLHETAGLSGNWALDYSARPGTPIFAVEAGTVTKLSGRDPNEDTWDSSGVYGWTVYFRTDDGYSYFVTHFGSRSVTLGQRVYPGTKLGSIGDQDFRPDHVHYGVTSPYGVADAKARILESSRATRV